MRLGEAAGACVSQPDYVDQLKSRQIEEWKHFHQMFIDGAIRQWCPRLRAYIRTHGRREIWHDDDTGPMNFTLPPHTLRLGLLFYVNYNTKTNFSFSSL